MTRDFATDPEVAADLIRRARSERDGARTCEAGNPFGSSAIVEHWPCRGGCGVMVGVTREGLDAFEASNRMLRARREEPIAKAKVMWCPDCKARYEDLLAMQRAKRRPAEQLELGGDATAEAQRPPARSSGMKQNPKGRRSL